MYYKTTETNVDNISKFYEDIYVITYLINKETKGL